MTSDLTGKDDTEHSGDDPDNGLEARDTERSLPIALLRARESLMVRFRPMLAAHGFTEQQWRVLRIVGEVEHIDATALAERSCILAPSLTRILRNLEKRGLLRRETSQSDARIKVIRCTETALKKIRQITPESQEIYEDIEARFSKEQIENLLDMLGELIQSSRSNDQ